jgi:hypothetical protein
MLYANKKAGRVAPQSSLKSVTKLGSEVTNNFLNQSDTGGNHLS